MPQHFVKWGSNRYPLLEGEPIRIGRAGQGTEIEIEDHLISREHGLLLVQKNDLFIQDTNSLNGIKVNGTRIEADSWVQLENGNKFQLQSTVFTVFIESDAADPSLAAGTVPHSNPETIHFLSGDNLKQDLITKGRLTIGRREDNDVVLDDPTISRVHAELSHSNGKFWVKDLDSMDGVFLNGDKILEKTEFGDEDTISIALYSISLISGQVDLREQAYAITANNISKQYNNGKVGLQPLSIDVASSDFVALMGPSGCGKSTLLKCLNGDNPSTSGEVFIHGLSLRKHFNLLKTKIGYVPQDDIIHRELTVHKTLYFAAKLRLPDDTTRDEIDQRIDKVINSLNLDQDSEKDIRTVKVKDLSGGQRKRVSIAVELLIEPTILFLDEPTSPLDPESIDSFLKSLQQLTREGTTIVMVTHKPEDLQYVDNVIFLMVRGFITYFGRIDQVLPRFQVDDIIKVYAKLSDIINLEHNIETYYLAPAEENSNQKPAGEEFNQKKTNSALLQLFWLTIRYFVIKISDFQNLLLLAAQPVIIAGLLCLIFDELQVGVLFMLAISAIWFGVSNAAKEIVGELPIYRRERMFNLYINTYILSKLIVLSLIALIQTTLFIGIVYLKFRFTVPETFPDIYLQSFIPNLMFMFFIATSATLIGLLLSSYFSTTEQVMTVVPIALMPQIMLSGVITRIDNVVIEVLSFATLGRWGTEAFGRIQDNSYNTEPGQPILSVVNVIPGSDEIASASAMNILNYYDQNLIDQGKLIGSVFNSFEANIAVVASLNLIIYGLIYYSLRRKDSL